MADKTTARVAIQEQIARTWHAEHGDLHMDASDGTGTLKVTLRRKPTAGRSRPAGDLEGDEVSVVSDFLARITER